MGRKKGPTEADGCKEVSQMKGRTGTLARGESGAEVRAGERRWEVRRQVAVWTSLALRTSQKENRLWG